MIVIDSEFESLLPPLSDEAYRKLESQILADGLREPLTIWKGCNILVDGHNRYRICEKHGIEIKTFEKEFENRDAAKIWAVDNQEGRRNLNDAERMEVAIKLKPSIVAEAKRKHAANGGNHGNQHTGGKVAACPKSDTPPPKFHTDVEMARIAKVGKGKMREYEEIVKKADEGDPVAIKERETLLSGEKKSVHGSHIKVFGKKPPRKLKDATGEDGRIICAMCGEPIDPGDSLPSRPTVHKKCEKEYQRDWEREKRKVPKLTEDGRRICKFCGEPIEPNKHYQDKLNWCYKCGLEHAIEIQRRYRDADHDLRENVAIYNIDSLVIELTASVINMRDAVMQSIEINESMGVKLTERQKASLNKSIEKILETIEEMKG